jgi:signal transduction histidine kinase
LPFVIEEPRLTPQSTDQLFQDFLGYLHQEPARGNVAIDLTRLEFIAPYGLVGICLLGRYARTFSPQVSYRLPDSYALRSYLGRVRFAEAMGSLVEMSGPPLLVDPGREKSESEALLELTRIEERADVESLLEHIGQRVEVILAEELGYREIEITQFKNVVAELCHNILDHSMNWGYVTAQRYLDPRLHKKYVVIGVGDLGIGVKKSLSCRFDVAQWSHGQALIKSLKKHFSRDSERGLGLYIVNQICHRYNGNLHFRSGDTRVYIRRRQQTQYVSAFFPGTLLSITLYQKDG